MTDVPLINALLEWRAAREAISGGVAEVALLDASQRVANAESP